LGGLTFVNRYNPFIGKVSKLFIKPALSLNNKYKDKIPSTTPKTPDKAGLKIGSQSLR